MMRSRPLLRGYRPTNNQTRASSERPICLRTLTRAVTYGVLFGAGYGLVLGPVFGVASGIAHGTTLAWEYSRASRHEPQPGAWADTAMSAIRGLGFALQDRGSAPQCLPTTHPMGI